MPTAAAAAAAAEVGLGQAGPNAAYLGSRLRYEQQPEQPFDPIANNRYLRAVLARAGMYALIYFMGAFVGGIFFAIAGLAVLGAARGLPSAVPAERVVVGQRRTAVGACSCHDSSPIRRK